MEKNTLSKKSAVFILLFSLISSLVFSQEIGVRGNGNNITDGDTTPTVTDNTSFGSADVSIGSVLNSFTIRNTGASSLTIGAITFSGANAADFTVSTLPPGTIAAGGSANFVITFNPSAVGLRTATFSMVNNDSNENPFNFAISGTGTTAEINVTGNAVSIVSGDITPTTADWTDFGSVNIIGSTSISRTFTISNSGASTGPVNITSYTIAGAGAANFSITTPPAVTIPIGASTTIVVAFNPSAVGTSTAYISIGNNDTDENPYTFYIKGNGTDPEINVQGNLNNIVSGDVTPSVMDNTDFGTINAASGTIDQPYVIQNQAIGTSPLNCTVTITGPDAANFSVTVAPAASIAVGGNSTFIVTFNPINSGTKNATVTITNNDSNENPYNFAIVGIGIDPEMNVQGSGFNIVDGDITPTNADGTDFGITDITSTVITKTFTIENTSAATMKLTIGAISITGANAADFSFTNPLATHLFPNTSTTFTISFDPTTVGVKNATVNILNNDSDESPYNFDVRGTGATPEINLVGNAASIVDGDITPQAADFTDFGTTDIGAGTVTRLFTIQNTAAATMPLSVGALTITGTNAADFSVTVLPASSVAVNSSTTFQITFNPSAVGTRTAMINIVSNDQNENPYNFSIQGNGTDAEINVQGNAFNIASGDVVPSGADNTSFGATFINGGTIAKTFVIQNQAAATAPLNITSITFSGTNAADFSVGSLPGSIAPGASANVVITFNPNAVGLRTATVNIFNNDSNENPYTFAIEGSGNDPEMNLQGNAIDIVDGDATPTATDGTDIGTMDVAVGTVVKTFTIQNKATATSVLNIGTITVTGAAAGDFSVSAPGTATVAINSSTTFTVTFNPTAPGVRDAVINLANNDSDEAPYDFAVTGFGTDCEIDVTGNSISIVDGDVTPSASDDTDFGAANMAGAIVVKTYTITNTSAASMPLTIGAFSVTGANPTDFTITPSAVSTLAVGQSTTFTVTFNPITNGFRNAIINIVNSDSNESPYNFSVRGEGTSPEINVVGNLITIVDNDVTPSVSDNTDFGTVSIDAGSTLVTYTIQNSGIGTLNITAVMFFGADAANFSVVSAPSTVAAGGNAALIVSFSPTTVGVKNAILQINNDDSSENPYNFAITGFGVRTYADTDGDNISDNYDIDDDNDGILDTVEQANCMGNPLSNSVQYTFLNETFGAGTTKGLININVPGATCTYCYEDGVVGPNTTFCPSQSSWILDDGEYVVVHKIAGTVASDPENIHGDLAWNGLVDHTVGDTNGRMAVFNASFTPGIFYETTINGIIPNVPVTYSFWVMNIMQQFNYSGSILPNITVEFLDIDYNVLATFNTGNIGRCSTNTADNSCSASNWINYTTSINLGNVTDFTIRFRNNAPGGGGNDLAIDDITLKQEYCDWDGDGIANIFDLDSDNDGIADIEEAGLKHLSAGRGIMDIGGADWYDDNYNGVNDEIDFALAMGTYSVPDTDGDGANDFVDLDSDNDSIFDVDEAGLLNGDGDIDGDGFGDGLDTDSDGFLNLYDSFIGYGTTARPYAKNSNGVGNPDYLEPDSITGTYDIAATLYSGLDANGDGLIDGAGDIDKDGITDTFDTSTTVLGSPRDLTRKLFLDFDGRNDYAEGTNVLTGLPKATIMGWIKLSNPYTLTGVIFGQDNFDLKVDTSSGKKLTATAKGVTITYPTDLVVDRWYHVAAVYDGANATEKLKLYVNGNKEVISNSGSLAGSLNASATRFTMGKNAVTTTQYFKGSMDEVRVFNTALTSDQLQKMVYQEIKSNGAAIRGEVIPKDIESSSWANLVGYYRMDAYKDDVIDNYTTAAIDAGASVTFARIYNVKNIKYQLAPLPFITTQTGGIDTAVSQNNFVNGADVYTYDWSIINVKHDVTINANNTDIGMIVDPGVTVLANNDNQIKNLWYLKLDGKIDLQGRSQLVQTAASDLAPTSSGSIERDQQGQAIKFNYNYWCSPVGAINATTNNNAYTVAGVMKDGTNAANPQNILWTSGLNGSATSPITLSSYWIFKFQNVSNDYANWASVGQNGSLLAGQGFTLKGSSAALPKQNYVFVGKPNNGVITTTVAANNLNLSGNPYPSALDADAFITDNLSTTTGTLYFWEHFSTNTTHVLADYQGGYATRTLVGGTPPVSPSYVSGLGSSTRVPGRFIPVGQGFFVTGSSSGGTVTFNNAQRGFVKETDATSNEMFRQTNALVQAGNSSQITNNNSQNNGNNNEDEYAVDTYSRIRLGFNSTNNYHRQVLLGFMDDKATDGIDPGYDALNIDNQPNDMYFMNGAVKLNIQGASYFSSNNIFPLGIKSAAAGTVKFILDGIENFDPSQEIYIHDNLTGIDHDIKSQAIALAVPAGLTENRFSLRFHTNSSSSKPDEMSEEDLIHAAYTNNDSMLNIQNQIVDATVETVTLYNMLGQFIATWTVEEQNQMNIKIPVSNLSTGTYIVKIKTTTGDVTKKIAIR